MSKRRTGRVCGTIKRALQMAKFIVTQGGDEGIDSAEILKNVYGGDEKSYQVKRIKFELDRKIIEECFGGEFIADKFVKSKGWSWRCVGNSNFLNFIIGGIE